jgi:hypothetical protein
MSTALEIRSRKLAERGTEIRQLLTRENQAKCSWAYLAVELGKQFRDSLKDWECDDVKNPSTQWMKWLIAHTGYARSTIYLYVEMANTYEAATEEQQNALLRAGSIRGFHLTEENKEKLSNALDEPKGFPPETAILNGFGRWKKQVKSGPPITEWHQESRLMFKNEILELKDQIRAVLTPEELWPERFA